MQPMTDAELQQQWLDAGNTIKVLPSHREVFEPYQGKLQKTGPKPVFDKCGNRVYQFTNKTINILPLDETMLNYGE